MSNECIKSLHDCNGICARILKFIIYSYQFDTILCTNGTCGEGLSAFKSHDMNAQVTEIFVELYAHISKLSNEVD